MVSAMMHDSEWFSGGPLRFRGITDWAVRQVKKGERPLIYIGDGHTSTLALRRYDVLTGDPREEWRYEPQYLLKEHLEEAGFRPVVIHLISKTVLAQQTDDLFTRLYQEFDGDKDRFLLKLNFFYQDLVQPHEVEAYFIEVGEEEYLYVFPDEESFIAPPISAWVSAQRYLENEYPEEVAQHTLYRSVRTGGILSYGIPGIDPHELIWVSEQTGEVVRAILSK